MEARRAAKERVVDMTGGEMTWIEHPDVIRTAIYVLSCCVLAMGGAVIALGRWGVNRFSDDLKEVKMALSALADTMATRVGKLENDVNCLWHEHRIISQECRGKCTGHHHARMSDYHYSPADETDN